MYVADVLAKIANDIPKNVKKQIILFHKKGLKQFIVLPKLEYQCWQSALDWRIRKHWGCLETSIWWLFLPQSNSFQDPKAISQLNFERRSNLTIFVGFIWLVKADTRNFSQKCQQMFLPDALFFEQ